MSLAWVILGTIMQVVLAMFLFVLVAFSAGGIANLFPPNKFQSSILKISLYLLPALCVVSAGVVIYQYNASGSAASYWWYCLPVAFALIYIVYAIKLNK